MFSVSKVGHASSMGPPVIGGGGGGGFLVVKQAVEFPQVLASVCNFTSL